MAQPGHLVSTSGTSHMTARMDRFELLDIAGAHGCEAVHLAADPATGMRAVVAVHSTVLGPGLGGTRFQAYPDEAAAVVDVCRLARGMTYKHAACGNDQGGGKAVLIGEPSSIRSDALVEAYARFVDRLGGVYLTAEDMGSTQADMDLIRGITPYVTGTSLELGGSGDPSPATAWGLRWAMAAVAERLWGSASLEGRHVVVLGTGKVGSALARHLRDDGARLSLADVRADAVAALATELGAEVVSPDEALGIECDVLSPCAGGAVFDEPAIARLRCAAVCGAANNQLATDADGERLAAAGVLYAPDYVVNAGGVVNIAEEAAPGGYDPDRARARVEQIAGTLRRVFALADEHGIVPAVAADRVAEARLEAASPQR